MKVAIGAEKDDENSQVSAKGARAPFFLIFEDGKLVKKIKNPFIIGGGGAGFSVAEMLSDERVDKVVCGAFGPNMTGALDGKGIKYEQKSGVSVKEALGQT
ncbi:MAG: NifB/NifX family molybdenum-iron cluster-binding protein [Candidatus Aenigmarchaeota archaeon]|nr:NifB/NifX family molybdenum-iron cluster-binding protein [Candidatus Aenigmarchaeota archaeon]